MLLKGYGNGGFTAGGQAGEPEGEAFLAAQGAAFVVGEAVVPCYVPGGEGFSGVKIGGEEGKRRTYVAIAIRDSVVFGKDFNVGTKREVQEA